MSQQTKDGPKASCINCWCYTSTKGSGGHGGLSLYIRVFKKAKTKKEKNPKATCSFHFGKENLFTGDRFGPLSLVTIFFLGDANRLYRYYRIPPVTLSLLLPARLSTKLYLCLLGKQSDTVEMGF